MKFFLVNPKQHLLFLLFLTANLSFEVFSSIYVSGSSLLPSISTSAVLAQQSLLFLTELKHQPFPLRLVCISTHAVFSQSLCLLSLHVNTIPSFYWLQGEWLNTMVLLVTVYSPTSARPSPCWDQPTCSSAQNTLLPLLHPSKSICPWRPTSRLSPWFPSTICQCIIVLLALPWHSLCSIKCCSSQ